MILDGWTVGLTVGGGMLLLPVLHGSLVGGRILRRWDATSSDAAQLRLERQEELVALGLDVALGLLLLQTLLFVLLLDRLADLLVGAMCATGVVRASSFGLPALLAKGGTLLALAVWRALFRADRLVGGFPNARPRAKVLLFLVLPLVGLDFALQTAFFFDLQPDQVTSCCAVAFRLAPSKTQELLDGLSPGRTLGLFAGGLALLLATGSTARTRALRGGPAARRSGWLFAAAALLFVFLFLVAVTALFGGYVYGSPAHRCPFCMLRGAPAWLGWPTYGLLLAGASAAIGGATLAQAWPRDEEGAVIRTLARRRFGKALLYQFLAAAGIAAPALLWQLSTGVAISG